MIFGLPFIMLLIGIYFAKFRKQKSPQNNVQDIAINVIIPFRNEEKNLSTLQLQIQQNYQKNGAIFKDLQIYWVNDHSEDKGSQILLENKFDFEHLLHSPLEGKKAALNYAKSQIKNADYILYLDADIEISPDFFKTLGHHNISNFDILIGGVQMKSNNFWSYFWSADYMYQQYLGRFVGIFFRAPYWSSGAFWMHSSNLTLNLEEKYASGDDYFGLMDAISQKARYKYLNQYVSTPAPNTLKEGIEQRKRWASKIKTKAPVGLYLTGLVLMIAWTSFCLSLFISSLTQLYLLVGTLIILHGLIIGTAKPGHLLPFMICYPFYLICNPFYLLSNNYRWKGRLENL